MSQLTPQMCMTRAKSRDIKYTLQQYIIISSFHPELPVKYFKSFVILLTYDALNCVIPCTHLNVTLRLLFQNRVT